MRMLKKMSMKCSFKKNRIYLNKNPIERKFMVILHVHHRFKRKKRIEERNFKTVHCTEGELKRMRNQL